MATAAGSSGDEPEDIFECALCLGTLRKPQILPCGHSFCSGCLVDLHTSDVAKSILPSNQFGCLGSLHTSDVAKSILPSNQLRCPSCRQTHVLPNGGVQELPVDHRTNKMMSKWSSKTDCNMRSALMCVSCLSSGCDTEATSYCFNCTFSICEGCTAKHKRHPMKLNHQVMTFDKHNLKDVLCTSHSNEVLCFFCLTCSVAVCHVCSDEHHDHNLTGYTSCKNSTHQLGHKLKEQLCTIKEDIISKQSKFDEIEALNENCRANVADDINKHADHQIKEIENQRRMLLQSTMKNHSTITGQISEVKTKRNEFLVQLTRHIGHLDEILTPLGVQNQLFPDGRIQLDGIQATIRDMRYPSMISMTKWKFTPHLSASVGSIDTQPIELVKDHNVRLLEVEETYLDGDLSKDTFDPKPVSVSGDQSKSTNNLEFFYRYRSLLNNLTKETYQEIVGRIVDLDINTEARLAGVVDITFERAISHPASSLPCANLCKCISNLKVPQDNNPGEYVMFRKLLLGRVQKEFEKDQEVQERRRSLGNITFLGELFKLRMITETIMHDCLLKLLKQRDDHSLECVCQLMSRMGKDLDNKRAKRRMDQYFEELEKIISTFQTPPRICSMIRDVVILRKNKWMPY